MTEEIHAPPTDAAERFKAPKPEYMERNDVYFNRVVERFEDWANANLDQSPRDVHEWDKRPSRDIPAGVVFLDDMIDSAKVVAGYEPLALILQEALDQSQRGKGNERHANGREFERQPIMEIGRMVGIGYPTGQASKKIQEAVGMFNRDEADRAVNELLGAIIYSAAAILLIRETSMKGE